MEQEPEFRELGTFRLEFDTGFELYCHRQNTSAFLHNLEPKYDHLFVLHPEEPEAVPPLPERGDYVFREQISNFQEIVGRMALGDWVVIKADRANEDDKEAYEEFRATKERNIQKRHELEEQIGKTALTPRLNLRVGFLAYLLQNEHLTADDFLGSGELYL